MTRAVILIAFLLTLLEGARAQDTCRVFSIPNPHGAAMTISRVWVQDSVNFSVEPVRAVPFNLAADELWDARVCIKPRDGQSYSTIIRYQTTHGPASYQVTMVAPTTAAVSMEHQDATMGMKVYPVPSSGDLTIEPPVERGDILTVEVYDGMGGLRSVVEERYEGGHLRLDLSRLPSGRYRIMVRGSEGVVGVGTALIVR